MEIRARLETTCHPGSPDEWRLALGVAEKLAAEAVGLPVTVNYDRERVVGRVVSAEFVDGTVDVTVEANEDLRLDEDLRLALGPELAVSGRVDGEIRDATLKGISILTDRPTTWNATRR